MLVNTNQPNIDLQYNKGCDVTQWLESNIDLENGKLLRIICIQNKPDAKS